MTKKNLKNWKRFAADLQVGEKVDTVFLLTRLTLREYAKGHFLSIRLSDKSGKVSGVVWENAEAIYNTVKEGDLVSIEGKVGTYQNEKQIQVHSMRKVEDQESMDPSNFLQVSPVPLEKLTNEFDMVISSVLDRDYNALLVAFRNHEGYWSRFAKAPGAKLWHHPYLHGLLEHTLSAVRICTAVADNYPHVNRDLLVTGTIFHDVGKLEEFEYARKFDYTTDGRLMGHLFLGAKIVDNLIESLDAFPADKRRLLMHMILSHHGEVERSPIVPMTLEACLLHHIENMDAQMMAFEREMDKAREENQDWTGYVKLIERYLYLGEVESGNDNIIEEETKEQNEPKAEKKAKKVDEPSLF